MKVGRNDDCPCGSGKKFKHCHLGRQAELAAGSDGVVHTVTPGPDRRVLAGLAGAGLALGAAAGAWKGIGAGFVVVISFVLFGVGYAILRNPQAR